MAVPLPRVPAMEEELDSVLPFNLMEAPYNPLIALHGLTELHASVSAKLPQLRIADLESLPPSSQKPRRQSFDGTHLPTSSPLTNNTPALVPLPLPPSSVSHIYGIDVLPLTLCCGTEVRPGGILKAGWLAKHTLLKPAVIATLVQWAPAADGGRTLPSQANRDEHAC